jgi:hypothetical protein
MEKRETGEAKRGSGIKGESDRLSQIVREFRAREYESERGSGDERQEETSTLRRSLACKRHKGNQLVGSINS